MKPESELRKLINQHLQQCDATILPTLKEKISTPEGMQTVGEMVYNICSTEGVSVQTAMSQLDSSL
jgi:hypothetical protein